MREPDTTVLDLAKVRINNRVFRIDSQYFSKEAIENERTLRNGRCETLGSISKRIESFGAYALTNQISYVEEGVPFLRCLNIKNGFADLTNSLYITDQGHRLLHKSAVEPEMVLLTMSGSVGEVAVALPWWPYPMNSNQDIAKITVRAGLNPYFLTAFLGGRYGRIQTARLPVGSVQQHIFLWMLEELIVVRRFSSEFEGRVGDAVLTAYRARMQALAEFQHAEEVLADAVGLRDWDPPRPLTYLRSSVDVMNARRLDAQYFAPRVTELLSRLQRGGRTVGDVAPQRRQRFVPSRSGTFNYIEIGDVRADGTAEAVEIEMVDAPSRATWYVMADDVITSTVRPIRRLSALVTPKQDGSVASSGFVVLEPSSVPSEVLLAYLRFPAVCELMDLFTSASMYPAISDRDVLALPFPKLSDAAMAEIVKAVQSAHDWGRAAESHFVRGMRAVEAAVDKSESCGFSVLDS